MNLLPWREALAKQKLFSDSLLTCAIAALVALAFEISLGILLAYSSYFSWQTKKVEGKLLQQQNDYKISADLQQQLTLQQKKLNEIQQNQAQWKDTLQLLQIITTQKPASLNLLHLQIEKNMWQIQGNAPNFVLLESYQQKLLASFKQVDIGRWQPNANRNNANFELNLKP